MCSNSFSIRNRLNEIRLSINSLLNICEYALPRYSITIDLILTFKGCMFPLPRVVYAMADDGLIFRGLASINEKTKTPVVATLSMASLAALLAAIFDIKELVDFMSIGTLMAYTLVAASVMILRYRRMFVYGYSVSLIHNV